MGVASQAKAPTATFEQVRQRLKHPFINPGVSLSSIIEASVFVALSSAIYVLGFIALREARSEAARFAGNLILGS